MVFFAYADDYQVCPPDSVHSYGRSYALLVRPYMPEQEMYWCPNNKNHATEVWQTAPTCPCGSSNVNFTVRGWPFWSDYGWNAWDNNSAAIGRRGMIGRGTWYHCCWGPGQLPDDSGIMPSWIVNTDAIWQFCRTWHWGALNVRSTDPADPRKAFPDFYGPAVFEGDGSLAAIRTGGQPGTHHQGGFDTLHADGHVGYFKYGRTTIEDWTAYGR